MPKEKKNLLKNLKVSSVDLCEQGANQKAYICLKKSEDKRKDGFFKKFFYAVAKTARMTEEQLMELEETEPEQIKDAMKKSFESILVDENLNEEERKEMIQKNVNDFYQDVEKLIKSNLEKKT